MAQDWDIKPRSERCHGCETPFGDKQIYLSALAFGDEGYTRTDYCEKCWSGNIKSASPYSVWRGVFRIPPPQPEEPLKKETAESLLRSLMGKEDESKRNVMYILAVMLERKRILAERDVQTRDDGIMIRVYEHRGTGETFLVPDPQLHLDQLEQVQQEIAEMLGKPEVGGQKSATSPPAGSSGHLPAKAGDVKDKEQTTEAQTPAKSNSH